MQIIVYEIFIILKPLPTSMLTLKLVTSNASTMLFMILVFIFTSLIMTLAVTCERDKFSYVRELPWL